MLPFAAITLIFGGKFIKKLNENGELIEFAKFAVLATIIGLSLFAFMTGASNLIAIIIMKGLI